jgi:ABC-2 type transport system permease protein
MNLREQYVAFMTILRKEIKRYLRIWTQTLLPSAITMSLYFVIFGTLIGSRIGKMGGFTYMEFVVPGLIMMAIVTNSYSNVVSFMVRNSATAWKSCWCPRYLILSF